MSLPSGVIAALFADPLLPENFADLCDCGGRLAGTKSERRALDLVRRLGKSATGRPAQVIATPYDGWRAATSSLALLTDHRDPVSLTHLPLIRSAPTPPGGVEAEVVDVGRGTPEEFAALGRALLGRFALVRHEYMFAAGHIHRRAKYAAAVAAGARGFLIAGPLPAAAVAGSSGRGAEAGIPAFGISPEAAARLRPARGVARLQAELLTNEFATETETILFDVPGASDEWIVLSAHVDGHAPAESAIDNASGVAVALAVARALAPYAKWFRRGLRLALFSAEEWALAGSRFYLDTMTNAEREKLRLNINLDSVGGDGTLTALCSGFVGLRDFVRDTTAQVGVRVGTHMPLMTNSDHANFAASGIPALRLVAGFEQTSSDLKHVLTAADTRDKVTDSELRIAAVTAAALTWAALVGDLPGLARLRGESGTIPPL